MFASRRVARCSPWSGIARLEVAFDKIQSINAEEVKAEILSQEELFLKLAGDLPKEMIFQRELLVSRL